MSGVFIVDLETENHGYYGADASPRHPDNYVVAIGSVYESTPYEGVIQGAYYKSKDEVPADWFKIPRGTQLLVLHNAPFDCGWFLAKARPEFMRFLKEGGRIFDTAYAEYLLSHQQDLYPALEATAQKYGGTAKVNGVKILWEQGLLTSQIDKDLLYDQYLLSDEGDIANTRKVFYGQVEALQKHGMWDMALTRMEGLLYNILAMDSGMHIHRDVAFELKAEAEGRLQQYTEAFQQWRQDIPEYVEFKDTSPFHQSAWLFGGPVKYRVKDIWFEEDGVTPKYEKAECFKYGDTYIPTSTHIRAINETHAALVQQYGEAAVYKSGKNKGAKKIFKVDTDTPRMKWYDRTLELPSIVDLNLLPKDIREDFLREYTGKRTLADGSPVISTGADAIKVLALRHEFPEEVLQLLHTLQVFAKVNKDLGTYYLREEFDDEGNVVKQSGMLQYLTEHDIVYHVLNATATATTRLSATRPNFQNLPRGDTIEGEDFGSEVKKMFTSRYDNPLWLDWALENGRISQEVHDECATLIARGERAGAIIEADYSALEVVTLAAFSKDKNLVDALLAGTDMHCLRLSEKLAEPYDEVYEKCHNEGHPQHKEYKQMRTDIKPPSFAYQYGATAMGIAYATGCTVEYAEQFIDAEKKLFPGVESFFEDVIFPAVEQSTTMHREVFDSGGFRLYGRGTWQSPGGTVYEFRQYPKARWVDGHRVELMEYKPTQMRNYPIQGESAYFVQGMAGQIARWLIQQDFFGGRVCIINQVHDAVYLDCTLSVLRNVALSVKYILESLPEYFAALGYDLGVPFPAAVEAGPSMYKKESINE